MTAAQWTVTKVRRGLGQSTAAWDELNKRHFSSHPMLSSIFINAALEHFDNGQVHLCVLEGPLGPEAICLLTPRSAGVWTSFLPSQAQIGPTLIRQPELMAELMKCLPGVVTEIDFLCQDPAFSNFPEVVSMGSNVVDHALTMCVRMDHGFEAYWQSRSKRLVGNIARYGRRVVADGISTSLTCITRKEDMAEAVQRYATLESLGWKGKNGTALGVDNEQGVFYSEVMTQFAASDNALVFELRFNGQLVASRLMVCCGVMVVILKTAFDETFTKYAPGRLLLRDVLRELALRKPGLAVEFYTDATTDQLSWATDQRWIRHVAIYRSDAAKICPDGAQILVLTGAVRKLKYSGIRTNCQTTSGRPFHRENRAIFRLVQTGMAIWWTPFLTATQGFNFMCFAITGMRLLLCLSWLKPAALELASDR
jgi:Acetyltransferase (GNAT) domain